MHEVEEKAREIGLCDANQTVSITKNFDGHTIDHLLDLPDDIKFITEDGNGVMNNATMARVFAVAAERGLTVMSHAEDREISPWDYRLAENIETVRNCHLAEYYGTRLHMCHVSTKESVDMVRQSRRRGAMVSCEVTPHHLWFTNDTCDYRVNPPIRTADDVQALDCDFYAFSGHKLYGPTGIGVLYGKEKWLEQMPPFMGGGDMVGTVRFSGTTYAELPLKFEAGTSNYIGAIGLGEAIRYLGTLDAGEVARREHELLVYATERLQRIDGLRIYGTQPDKCSIVSFTVEGTHPYDIGMILDKTGVAVRTGTHCAEPVMTHYGITSMVRASFALYNEFSEIDRLEAGLQRAVGMLRA